MMTTTLLATALLVAPAAASAAPAATPAPLSDPPLVMTSDRDGDAEVWVRETDGRLRQVTRSAAADYGASWSPDGRRLAFVSERDGDAEVFTVDADGTGLRQLTRNRAQDQSPRWSPDGRYLAFSSSRDGGETEIYRMRSDGTQQVRLTRTAAHVADHAPSWSPGGHYLLFTSNREGHEDFEVFRMRANGTSVTALTRTPSSIGDTSPEYSPDGRSIAFTSERGGRGQGVYVMGADGSGVRAVVDRADVDEVQPRWLRDGSGLVHAVFASAQRSAGLGIVRTDGTGWRELAPAPTDEFDADPRPR